MNAVLRGILPRGDPSRCFSVSLLPSYEGGVIASRPRFNLGKESIIVLESFRKALRASWLLHLTFNVLLFACVFWLIFRIIPMDMGRWPYGPAMAGAVVLFLMHRLKFRKEALSMESSSAS